MTNGQPLRVRAAMKPISTVPRALATVDMATGDEAVAIHQRSDVCAVPAAGVVVETMVALVLARAALEKFGGDSLTETRATSTATCGLWPTRDAGSERRRRRRADGTESSAGRNAGLGQVHDRAAAGQGDRSRAAGHRRRDRARPPAAPSPTSSPPTASRSSAASRRKWFATHSPTHDGIVSLGGGAITSPGVREALSGHTVVFLEISAAEGMRRTSGSTVRPLLAGGDPAEKYRELMSERVPLYRRVATIRVNTNRRNPGAVVRSIVTRLENPRADDTPPKPRRRRRPPWRRATVVAARRARRDHRDARHRRRAGPSREART